MLFITTCSLTRLETNKHITFFLAAIVFKLSGLFIINLDDILSLILDTLLYYLSNWLMKTQASLQLSVFSHLWSCCNGNLITEFIILQGHSSKVTLLKPETQNLIRGRGTQGGCPKPVVQTKNSETPKSKNPG